MPASVQQMNAGNKQNTGSLQQSRQNGGNTVNVGEAERWASTVGGAALTLYGLTHRSRNGTMLTLLGSSLIYRGTTGHCSLYQALDVNTASTANKNVGANAPVHGIKVEKSVTVKKSPEELYRFWRNFENLPRFMKHLESVQVTDGKRSHWIAKAPANSTVEWDAEISNEQENKLIAWCSLEGSEVDSPGSVRFEAAPGGRGTMVRVALEYSPPGSVVGAAVAKLFGESPAQQIEDGLRRFKQIMETGEIPTTKGQSSGRNTVNER